MMNDNKISLLVVDDEASVRDSLSEWLSKEDWNVIASSNAYEALKTASSQTIHIALLDIKLPGMDGIELERRLRELDPSMVIIIMTAYGTIPSAVQAMKDGAYDYITKPFNPIEVTNIIKNAIQDRMLLKDFKAERAVFLTEDERMKRIVQQSESLALSDSTVIFQGERGTGKELLARIIHFHSPRKSFHFVPVICRGPSKISLEQDLFGFEKRAVQGTNFRRKGKVELSDKGTLFLDGLEEVPVNLQNDLIRAVTEKQVIRISGDYPIPVDLRLISAIRGNSRKLINSGRLTENFVNVLNSVVITLLPLRERKCDIPLLAKYFAERFALSVNKSVSSISKEAMDILLNYTYPGNVRELRNIIERAVILCDDKEIKKENISLSESGGQFLPEDGTITSLEKSHILAILDDTEWNISLSARRLGIDRTTLYRKIERYGIERR